MNYCSIWSELAGPGSLSSGVLHASTTAVHCWWCKKTLIWRIATNRQIFVNLTNCDVYLCIFWAVYHPAYCMPVPLLVELNHTNSNVELRLIAIPLNIALHISIHSLHTFSLITLRMFSHKIFSKNTMLQSNFKTNADKHFWPRNLEIDKTDVLLTEEGVGAVAAMHSMFFCWDSKKLVLVTTQPGDRLLRPDVWSQEIHFHNKILMQKKSNWEFLAARELPEWVHATVLDFSLEFPSKYIGAHEVADSGSMSVTHIAMRRIPQIASSIDYKHTYTESILKLSPL